jgi:hypothetical protein
MIDGYIKSPDAALRFMAFRGHVPIPSGFRNMSPTPACGTFYVAVMNVISS